MYEVRFHGRGGQGAVTAAAMLAAALLEEGKYAVSIPSFGFERRGAPVVSFLRCSDRPIRQLTNIYAPDCLICVDPTLTRSVVPRLRSRTKISQRLLVSPATRLLACERNTT